MSRSYEFVQVDVFTQTPLTGNPLAIFPDARGLTDPQMRALAREMNLSETTFIFPREGDIEDWEGTRVRIFTVTEELPFAGHPTLGTALSLYSTRAASERPGQIVLDLNAGKVPVTFRPDSASAGVGQVDGKVFGEMRQRDPEFGPVLDPARVAEAVGINAKDIATDGPIQVISTGLPFAILPFHELETLANVTFNVTGADTILKGTGARFFYLIWAKPGGADIRARMFFYGGEDPATGSAAGCAASWLVRYGVLASDTQGLIRQGVEAGRPSDITVRATKDGDRVTDVRVGGYAVEVLRGTVTI